MPALRRRRHRYRRRLPRRADPHRRCDPDDRQQARRRRAVGARLALPGLDRAHRARMPCQRRHHDDEGRHRRPRRHRPGRRPRRHCRAAALCRGAGGPEPQDHRHQVRADSGDHHRRGRPRLLHPHRSRNQLPDAEAARLLDAYVVYVGFDSAGAPPPAKKKPAPSAEPVAKKPATQPAPKPAG